MQTAVLITTLARYQTRFWIMVAERLRRLGCAPAFLAFDDPSELLIRESGIKCFNAFELARHAGLASPANLERELVEHLQCTLPLALSHERVTFGLRDSAALTQKLARHRAAADMALVELSGAQRELVVVQELGGFLSVIGTFLAARSRGCDNLFIEPSFFKGRFLATRNTFAAPRVGRAARGEPLEPAALRHIEAARAAKAIVIPGKDRHHYAAALGKVARPANMRRLLEKLYEKYALRERHEFGYIGAYVGSHLRMVRNSFRLRGAYATLPAERPFVYYPLHVPADVALTLRAPEYLDQLSLVDFLARTIPATHLLAVKEHPAQIGALDSRWLLGLLARHDNVRLLHPALNNYDVLAAADAVVSVNSKSGAEALLVGKPVIVLGDAFYAESGLVTRVAALAELPRAIGGVLQQRPVPVRIEVERFFSRVWRSSLEGDLYVAEETNAESFARSLHRALAARSRAAELDALATSGPQ